MAEGLILVNGHELTPASQSPGGSQYQEDASRSNYILIHFSHILQPKEAEELRSLGVKLLHYYPENTYSGRYEPADLGPIRELAFVDFANVYHEDLAVPAGLKGKLMERGDADRKNIATATDETEPKEAVFKDEQPEDYHVFLHDKSQVQQALQRLQAIPSLDRSSLLDEGFGIIRARFLLRDLVLVTSLDEVARVVEIGEHGVSNHEARRVLGLDRGEDSYWYSGTAFENPAVKTALGTLDDALTGRGQTVVVADTGLDNGYDNNIHPAFTGRVAGIRVYNNRGSGFDDNGHGTHVAGSVLGSGVANEISIKGTAPEAFLIMQACSSDNTKKFTFRTGDATADLWKSELGVTGPNPPRIHSNSWGPTWNGTQKQYNAIATIIDNLVWNNPDWVIVFAAGNNGDKIVKGETAPGPSVGEEETAKNVITVGACENTHPLWKVPKVRQQEMGTAYKYVPGEPDGSPHTVLPYSGRGPVRDSSNRRKPDVVAPGAMVYSARSSQDRDLEENAITPVKGSSTYNPMKYGESASREYMYLHGTSMAAALVSGCCAGLRNAYKQIKNADPSASMIKALLVNGAIDISDGVSNGGPAPNNVQGFGRVSMLNSLLPLIGKDCGCYDSWKAYPPDPLTHGAKNILGPLRIFKSTSTLTATLVHPDKSGAALQNCLEMFVESALFKGSKGPKLSRAADSTTLAPNTALRQNNVQRLVWEDIPVGVYNIIINAIRVNQSDPNDASQHYAVCWDVR